MKRGSAPSKLIRIGGYGAVASAIFAVLPIGIVLAVGIIGNVLDCVVDESGTSVCMLLGVDIGGMLATIGILGWFALITIPIGVVIGALFLILLVIGLVLRGISNAQAK
jgi:hypothetical protein